MRKRWIGLVLAIAASPCPGQDPGREQGTADSGVRPSEGRRDEPTPLERLSAVLARVDSARLALEELRARNQRELAALDAEVESLRAEVERRRENVAAAEDRGRGVSEELDRKRTQRDRLREEVLSLARNLERFSSWLEAQLAAEPPWREDPRRQRLEEAAAALDRDPPDLGAALRTLWTAAAETIALASRCEAGKIEVRLAGQSLVVDALRVGSLAVLFVSPDGTKAGFSGAGFPETGSTGRSLATEEPQVWGDGAAAESIRRAIDILRRQKAPRRVSLPLPRSALQPPVDGLDLPVERAKEGPR
ncbi:MAG: DUF3450 family protein [Planctomycetota bacterium]